MAPDEIDKMAGKYVHRKPFNLCLLSILLYRGVGWRCVADKADELIKPVPGGVGMIRIAKVPFPHKPCCISGFPEKPGPGWYLHSRVHTGIFFIRGDPVRYSNLSAVAAGEESCTRRAADRRGDKRIDQPYTVSAQQPVNVRGMCVRMLQPYCPGAMVVAVYKYDIGLVCAGITRSSKEQQDSAQQNPLFSHFCLIRRLTRVR